MSRLTRIGSAVALALALTGASARADSVVAGQWYSFRFFDAGSLGVACASACVPIYPAVSAPAAPWTFTTATPFTLTIQALGTGDRFSLVSGATLVDSTSATAGRQSCATGSAETVVYYIADCQALPLSSRGTFAFAAGSYSFGIRADQVATVIGGAAVFRLDVPGAVVPEPSALALAGCGLVLLAGAGALRRPYSRG